MIKKLNRIEFFTLNHIESLYIHRHAKFSQGFPGKNNESILRAL